MYARSLLRQGSSCICESVTTVSLACLSLTALQVACQELESHEHVLDGQEWDQSTQAVPSTVYLFYKASHFCAIQK